MASLNPLAVTSADLLRAIETGSWTTRAELFESVGRNPKNCARDLTILETAGLIAVAADKAAAQPITLTDEGKAQLAAIGRAEHPGRPRVRPADGPRTGSGSGDPPNPGLGGATIAAPQRVPVANIIANPANRRVEDTAVAALADTIEAVGDVLEAVQLTPADANGVRMLLDGEHRWRAVQLLAEQARLPEALEKGLRFEEREATTAEQILIRIVTATARTDLTPLEDARQLLALQQATGWTARDIAKKTGRSPADSDTGVRDVQSKIRVARDATPFFLAQYELDGSWDRLRDSVTAKKPEAATPAAAPQPEPEPKAEVQTELDHEWLLDNPDWQSTEVEIREGSHYVRLRIFERLGGFPGWFVSLNTQVGDGGMGESYRVHPAHNPIHATRLEALQAARRRVLDRHPLAPAWVRNGLDQQLGPNFVNGRDCLNASNAGEARRAAGLEARKANSGSGPVKSSLPPAAQAVMAGKYTAPVTPPPTGTPSFTGTLSLGTRADLMGDAARAGSDLILAAAIAELTEAVDSHLAGIRRDLIKGGQDLAQFEEDTEALREAVTRAGDALEALGLGEGDGLAPVEERSKPPALGEPFVPLRKSITPDHITCLYDGRRFAGGLRRHLQTRYNETPDEYRRKWGLPADYPMVAPNHAKRQHDALRDAALRSALPASGREVRAAADDRGQQS